MRLADGGLDVDRFCLLYPSSFPGASKKLVVPTGGDKDDGDGASPLDGDGHDDRLVHPASADGEDISLPCLLRPSSSAVASMRVAMSQDLFKGLDSPLVPPAFAVDSLVIVTGGDED